MYKRTHLLPDFLPDDPRHFVTIQFHDWALHRDFVHLTGICCTQMHIRVSEGNHIVTGLAITTTVCNDEGLLT
jgi:hypothetical protein